MRNEQSRRRGGVRAARTRMSASQRLHERRMHNLAALWIVRAVYLLIIVWLFDFFRFIWDHYHSS